MDITYNLSYVDLFGTLTKSVCRAALVFFALLSVFAAIEWWSNSAANNVSVYDAENTSVMEWTSDSTAWMGGFPVE